MRGRDEVRRTAALAARALAILAGHLAWAGGSTVEARSPADAPADTVRMPLRIEAPRDTIPLGMPFDVRLEVVRGGLIQVGLATPEAALEPFEIVSWKRQLDRGDTVSVTLTLRSFRVGSPRIPPLVLAGVGDDGVLCLAAGDSIPIDVASIVPPDATQILDIGEAVRLAGPRVIWPYLAALGIALAAAAVVIVRRRRRAVAFELGSAGRPPGDVALEALAGLRRSPVAANGPWKAFYTELSDIVRRYLARRFGIDAPDLTTTEILREITRGEASEAARAALREVLTAADFVKFAKGSPRPEDPMLHIARAERLVALTTAPEVVGAREIA
jgi:hypothetical protein